MFHSEETGWRECTSCGKVSRQIVCPSVSYDTCLVGSCHVVLIELDWKHWQRLHCGCIASSLLLELLDTGGVNCKGCSNSSKHPSVRPILKLWATGQWKQHYLIFCWCTWYVFLVYICVYMCACVKFWEELWSFYCFNYIWTNLFAVRASLSVLKLSPRTLSLET